MYRVFLERAAERDLRQFSTTLHDRVIVAIQALAKTRAQLVAESLPEQKTTGGFA